MSEDRQTPSEPSNGNGPKDLLKLLESLASLSAMPKGTLQKDHEFWNTQPVPQSEKELVNVLADGPIREFVPEAIQREPYPLPNGFGFVLVDILAEKDMDELYRLLRDNYVEDYDSKFRFDYSKDFLEWALLPPGWDAQWHIGIRDENTELVAFISCSPCSLRARSNTLRAVDVNFLCVSKAHRSRRWAPLLIQEITRRANLAGIFQAIYTAGVSLPEPIAAANYYHRPLNNRKLIEAGFSFLPAGKSVDQMESFFKLPESVNLPRFRELGKSDIPAAKALLAQYSVKFGLAQVFDEQEFEHWFLPREKVVYSFVRFDESNEMDGFVSFYSIPTSILEPKASGHGIIEAAYLYYYAVKPDTEEHSLIPLIKAALIEAKRRGFDVVNCVEIMDGAVFLDSLKFGEGDGCLRYYLFNWRTKRMAPGDVAFVML